MPTITLKRGEDPMDAMIAEVGGELATDVTNELGASTGAVGAQDVDDNQDSGAAAAAAAKPPPPDDAPPQRDDLPPPPGLKSPPPDAPVCVKQTPRKKPPQYYYAVRVGYAAPSSAVRRYISVVVVHLTKR